MYLQRKKKSMISCSPENGCSLKGKFVFLQNFVSNFYFIYLLYSFFVQSLCLISTVAVMVGMVVTGMFYGDRYCML